MALWAHLRLADLPLEVVTRALPTDPSGRAPPLVIVQGGGTRARVVAVSAEARATGLGVGMSLASAWALAAGLEVRERDPKAEAAALEEVATWALQFSSLVCLDPPEGVTLEIGGSLGLFGGLERLLSEIRNGAGALGFTVTLAVAPNPLAARVLARAGRLEPAVERSALERCIADVPLVCFDLPEALVASLARMGLRRAGDCLGLPRAGLGRRAGEALAALDRALGRVPDPRRPYQPPSRFLRFLDLPEPVADAEAMLFVVNRLLHVLAGYLRSRASGVTRLVLILALDRPEGTELSERAGRARRLRITIGLVEASRDPGHLLLLVRERLSRLPLAARVSAIGLEAAQTGELAPDALDLFRGHRESGEAPPIAGLLERLAARLGDRAVHRLESVADHRPERAWETSGISERGGRARGEAHGPGSRPCWLLRAPHPLETIGEIPCLGGPLALLTSPERIESGWWDGDDVARDYFLAGNAVGERYWVFRDCRFPERWYLHGIFA